MESLFPRKVLGANGNNINFPSVVAVGVPQDFGTDGGVHNFLRYLENWGGQALNYRGSMASLYYSQYGTGVFKCCGTVYSPPTRNYAFDADFLDLSKMPRELRSSATSLTLAFNRSFGFGHIRSVS